MDRILKRQTIEYEDNSMVSVVMPVYNAEKYLAEAIESILKQTYAEFEFIIINDGSTDRSLAIIEEYRKRDNRIVCLSKENGGVASALNVGLAAAKGKYIVRMDSDDVSFPQRLQVLVDYMEQHTNVDICGSWALINGKKKMKVPTTNIEIKMYLLFYCAFIHPTVIIRKEYLERTGLSYNMVCAEDYDLWVRCNSTAIFANVPHCLLMYRRHENNITSSDNQEKFMQDDLRVKNLYCALQGFDIKLSKHFLADDFTEDELQKYEKIIMYMAEKYRPTQLPKDLKKRMIIIYIEQYGNVGMVLKRYRRFIVGLGYKVKVKDILYLSIKYITMNRYVRN